MQNFYLVDPAGGVNFGINMEQADLERFYEFLRFPSVSTDSSLRSSSIDCCRWVADLLTEHGFEVSIADTPGYPAVIGQWGKKPGAPTVMVYGHYDVQPAEPLDLWETPPFEPVERGGRIYARGATDNKGQILAHMLGMGRWLKHAGELPVNVVFLVEGEEEVGSPNLPRVLQERGADLACDVAVVSDTGMVGPGIPTLTYGLRGIACLEVVVTGPKGDLHSGIFGGAIANPATVLCRLLGQLHDQDGRVTVPGFYEGVRTIEAWEKEAWERLPVGDDEILEWTGVPELHGEKGHGSLARIWARPTLEINGVGGGYQGEGTKTIIPSKAFAKISCRLVPRQHHREVTAKVKAFIESLAPVGVKVEVRELHGGEPYLLDPRGKWGRAAQASLKECFGGEPALICEGGSVPIVQEFKEILGVDTLLLGLALPDANLHAPNENFPLENLEKGMELSAGLLRHIASAG